MHTHNYRTDFIYIHSETNGMHIYIFNQISLTTGTGQSDLLFVTPSVGHNSDSQNPMHTALDYSNIIYYKELSFDLLN
jgi:hypothetical protein